MRFLVHNIPSFLLEFIVIFLQILSENLDQIIYHCWENFLQI